LTLLENRRIEPSHVERIATRLKQKTNKKVLFLIRGDSTYDELFLNSFSKSFDVTCATFNPEPSIKFGTAKLIIMSDPFRFLYSHPKARYLTFAFGHREIRRIVEKEKPDIMVCSYSVTYGYVGAKANFHPLVLITFGSDVLLQTRSKFFGKRLDFVFSRADLLVADGLVAQKALVNEGVNQGKIVNFPRFDPKYVTEIKRAPDSPTLRSRLDIEDKKKIVLHTRWFEPVYNVETVVKAFAHAKEEIADLVLVLVGEGSLEEKIRSLVQNLKISNAVYFVGKLPREQLIPIYDEADVYVSACLSDSMNASLLEAICRSTPAIVSDSETNREWIESGSSGLLFDPNSPEELADKIMKVIREPQKYREMAFVAKSRVLQRINWQKGEAMLVQRMNELVSRF
jgi:glycosyltransferase involved in cell wall biosynthesis